MTKLEELVIVKDEDINSVREKYGKNPQEIQEDLKIIKEWLGKQPHLPEAASKDEGRLERQLMRNKFRLEKTKKKLDGYYTLRGLYPEFYHIPRIHPKSREMVEARSSSFVFPLPKMSNGERIWVFHVKNSDPSTFDFPILLSHILMILELTASLDYPLGDRWVIDVKNLTFGHFTRMEPIALGKWFKLHQESFSGRILGIHYLNAPSFMDVLLKLLKAVLSPKIYDRVKIHPNLEQLCEIIPREFLPEEYGGSNGSLEKLDSMWTEELEEQFPKFEESLELVSNEKLRVGPTPYNELFGADGTFKKINLD